MIVIQVYSILSVLLVEACEQNNPPDDYRGDNDELKKFFDLSFLSRQKYYLARLSI